jgi:hypothetical protein
MFERLKKAWVQEKAAHADGTQLDEIRTWSATHGIGFAALGDGPGFALAGHLGSWPWKLECVASSRDYIVGQELRARVETRVSESISVILMNRPLKDQLEERAYSLYTDSLQTEAQPGLLEEMRWMASYPEVGWVALSDEFSDRYAVMADRRTHAMEWLVDDLADLLRRWPAPAPEASVPFMLMLLRGKVHLRMQRTPDNLATLNHAVSVLLRAGQSAARSFSPDNAV